MDGPTHPASGRTTKQRHRIKLTPRRPRTRNIAHKTHPIMGNHPLDRLARQRLRIPQHMRKRTMNRAPHMPTHRSPTHHLAELVNIKTITMARPSLILLNPHLLTHRDHRLLDSLVQPRLAQLNQPPPGQHLHRHRLGQRRNHLQENPARQHPPQHLSRHSRPTQQRRNHQLRGTEGLPRHSQRPQNVQTGKHQRGNHLNLGVLHLSTGMARQLPQPRNRLHQRAHRILTRQQHVQLRNQRIPHLPRHHPQRPRPHPLHLSNQRIQLPPSLFPHLPHRKQSRLITLRPLRTRQIRHPPPLRRNLNPHPHPPQPPLPQTPKPNNTGPGQPHTTALRPPHPNPYPPTTAN